MFGNLAGGLGLVVILASVVFFITLFYFVPLRLWITAIFSGVKLGLFRDLVGMRLRNVPPIRIVAPLITAHKAGIQVTASQLEAHYLAGGARRSRWSTR